MPSRKWTPRSLRGAGPKSGNTGPRVKLTDERKAIYLQELAKTGLKNRSAGMAGVSLDQVRERRKIDKEFALACQTAESLFADSLVAEAHRRSVEGVDDPVYQKGYRVHEDCSSCRGAGRALVVHTDTDGTEQVAATGPICEDCKGTGKGKPAVITRRSDRLLEQMLKAYDPAFRDKQETNVTITGGVLAVPMTPASAEDWHKQYSQPAIDVTDESHALNDRIPPPTKK